MRPHDEYARRLVVRERGGDAALSAAEAGAARASWTRGGRAEEAGVGSGAAFAKVDGRLVAAAALLACVVIPTLFVAAQTVTRRDVSGVAPAGGAAGPEIHVLNVFAQVARAEAKARHQDAPADNAALGANMQQSRPEQGGSAPSQAPLSASDSSVQVKQGQPLPSSPSSPSATSVAQPAARGDASIDNRQEAEEDGPISTEDTPKYIVFDQTHGSVSNQMISFNSAYLAAYKYGLTLVLNYAFTPGGLRHWQHPQTKRPFYLVPTYLKLDLLKVKSIMIEDWIKTPDGRRFAGRRSPERLPFIMPHFSELTAVEKFYMNEQWPWYFNVEAIEDHELVPVWSKCEQLDVVDRLMAECKANNWRLKGMSCRALLLGKTFTNLDNCTSTHPQFAQLRSSMQPVSGMQRTVEQFLKLVRRPFITVHVRVVTEPEDDFAGLLGDAVEKALQAVPDWKTGTFYMMGMRDLRHKNTADTMQEYLKNRLKLTDAHFVHVSQMINRNGTIADWYEKEFGHTDLNMIKNDYGSIILDQWTSVHSDMYVGRTASTFSGFIRSWKVLLNKGRGINGIYMW
ncbi:hypothetical protein FVE85_8821 [Porphyridium purpureum]|uniref:O-fucosyltransferase family protein n=1 Tax=Porphyridium purpureum TaxID=35688 RepID=A0A5J4YPZ2_PORPP|nr:hypothetical protein FVE85_8821 [Porphyridium purpureum]|eukprot:POR4313..scf296_7